MAERPGIMFYFDDLEPALKMLSDEETGILFKAAMEYGHYGVIPEFYGMAAMAWSFIRSKIDRDRDAYQKTCVKNAYNRYLGECKRHGATPLSMETWEVEIYTPGQRALTGVDDGFISSPTTTGTTIGTGTSKVTPIAGAVGEGAGKGDGKGIQGEGRGETEGDPARLRRDAFEKLERYKRLQ